MVYGTAHRYQFTSDVRYSQAVWFTLGKRCCSQVTVHSHPYNVLLISRFTHNARYCSYCSVHSLRTALLEHNSFSNYGTTLDPVIHCLLWRALLVGSFSSTGTTPGPRLAIALRFFSVARLALPHRYFQGYDSFYKYVTRHSQRFTSHAWYFFMPLGSISDNGTTPKGRLIHPVRSSFGFVIHSPTTVHLD